MHRTRVEAGDSSKDDRRQSRFAYSLIKVVSSLLFFDSFLCLAKLAIDNMGTVLAVPKPTDRAGFHWYFVTLEAAPCSCKGLFHF